MKRKTLEEKLIKSYNRLEILLIVVIEMCIILLSISNQYETTYNVFFDFTSKDTILCCVKIILFSIIFIFPLYFLFEYLKAKAKN